MKRSLVSEGFRGSEMFLIQSLGVSERFQKGYRGVGPWRLARFSKFRKSLEIHGEQDFRKFW